MAQYGSSLSSHTRPRLPPAGGQRSSTTSDDRAGVGAPGTSPASGVSAVCTATDTGEAASSRGFAAKLAAGVDASAAAFLPAPRPLALRAGVSSRDLSLASGPETGNSRTDEAVEAALKGKLDGGDDA